jgi:hypothetical protein
VHQLTESAGFPPPIADLRSGRIWERPAVERWIASNPERLKGDDLIKRLFAGFTDAGTKVAMSAHSEARRLRHDYVGTEHLLLAVLSSDCVDVASRLGEIGLEHADMERRLHEVVPSGARPSKASLPYTGRAFHAMQTAIAARAAEGGVGVEPRHIAMAALLDEDGLALRLCADATGRAPEDVRARASELLGTASHRQTFAPVFEAGLELSCSFCSKSQSGVVKLIAGPGVYICDECVDLCNRIIAGDLGPNSVGSGPSDTGPDPARDVDRLDELAAEIAEIRRRLLDD